MLAVCRVGEKSPGNEFNSRLNKVYEEDSKLSPQTGGKTPSSKSVASIVNGATPAPAESSAPRSSSKTPITPANPPSVKSALQEAGSNLDTLDATLKKLDATPNPNDFPSSEKGGEWTHVEDNATYSEHPTPVKEGEGQSSSLSTPARPVPGRVADLLGTPKGTSNSNTPRSARSAPGSARRKVEANQSPSSFPVRVSETAETTNTAVKTKAAATPGKKQVQRALIPETPAKKQKQFSKVLPAVLFLVMLATAAVFGAALVLPPSSPPLSVLPQEWRQAVVQSPVYQKLSKHATPQYHKAATWADPYLQVMAAWTAPHYQKLSTWAQPYTEQASAWAAPKYQKASSWIIDLAKQYNITLGAPAKPEPVPELEEAVVTLPSTPKPAPSPVAVPEPVVAPKHIVPSPTPVVSKPTPAPEPAPKPSASETPKKKIPPAVVKETKRKQPPPQKQAAKNKNNFFSFWKTKPTKKSPLERLDLPVEVIAAAAGGVGLAGVVLTWLVLGRGAAAAPVVLEGPSTAPVIGGRYGEEEEEEADDGPNTRRGGRRGAGGKLPRINPHPKSGRLVSTYDADDDSPGGRAWRRVK